MDISQSERRKRKTAIPSTSKQDTEDQDTSKRKKIKTAKPKTSTLDLDRSGEDQATSSSSTNEEIDTLEMANRMKKNQGYHETEVSFKGETDLKKCLSLCEKNPGHKHFIPVKDFNIEHLPSKYQDSDIVDCVRAKADLTVRLSVTHISENRPEFFDDSKSRPFPFYKDRGRSDMMITGTGWVHSVNKYSEEVSEENIEYCRCKECLSSDTPKKIRGCVRISTAAHVVSDDIEAAHTTCHFFDDYGQTDLNNVLKLSGLEVINCDIKGDHCKMIYYTHDYDLLDYLDKVCRHCVDLEKKVIVRYIKMLNKNNSQSSAAKSRDLDVQDRLSVCVSVSHPHGCSKQVTVGRVTHRQTVESYKGLHDTIDGRLSSEYTQYTYNTSTCPGSSGAPLLILWGSDDDDDRGLPSLRCGEDPCHSGGERIDEENRNISTIHRESVLFLI